LQKCTGGLSLEIGEDHLNGMNSASGDIPTAQVTLGHTADRPVRNEIQHTAANVLLSVPGRQSSRRRRTIARLESDVLVRIPSDSADPEDFSKDQRVISQSSSDCTSMDNQVLVSDASRTAGGSTLSTSTMGKAPEAAKITGVLQQHTDARPSRLATVRGLLVDRGFSNTAAERISTRNRKSTSNIYQSRWRSFRVWCEHRELDPLEVSIPEIADFRMSLFNQNYQIGSIRGYKSAISSTLEHKGRHIGRNKDLTDLLQSLSLERPTRARTVPDWDLSLVLGMLNGELF
jgi:hypothetical protein